MSADIGVFHSSEVDDPTILPVGWYIGASRDGVLYADDSCVGPYDSHNDAIAAMHIGDYLYGYKCPGGKR